MLHFLVFLLWHGRFWKFSSKIYIVEPWMLPFCNSFTSIADQSTQKQLNNSVEAINGDFWLVTSTESKFKLERRAVLISSVTIDAVGKSFTSTHFFIPIVEKYKIVITLQKCILHSYIICNKIKYIFTTLIFSFKFISLCLFNEIDGTWCIYVHADHHLTQIGEYGISAYIFSNLHEMCLFMGPLEAYTLKTII